MAAEYDDQELFAQLFADEVLTPQAIYDQLTDIQFEFFVKYVFEQAGYRVEHTGYQHGPGLDLKVSFGLASGQVLHAGVQVKHFQPGVTKVTAPQVVSLRGGLPQASDVTGYFVTTSSFNDPALAEAQHGRRIWPIDGDHLVRYITYIRGSRAATVDDFDPDRSLHTNAVAPISPIVFFTADAIECRPAHSTTILTLANNKGGVGKTTSALNIALGLAALDQQVLLVDMDAQANLTRSLPLQAPSAAPGHIGDYFTRKRSLADLIRPTQFKRVWLIPSDSALSHADLGNAAGPGVELRFERDLHAQEIMPPQVLDARPFDWIIIDTNPHMGLFTRSALAASHSVIVPVSPSVFADQGTNLLTETVSTVVALTGRPISILGFLVTQWKEDALNTDLLAKFA
ncbi:MAG: AAA family ATPase, partial [Ktedonobacterales bacterium]